MDMDSRILSLRESGRNLTSKGEYDQAIELLNEAIQLDDKYPALYSDRGQAYYKKGDIKQAISDFKMALDGMPSNDFYRKQLNEALVASGSKEIPAAIEVSKKKFLITLLVTGVIGGGIGVLAGGLAGLFIGLFFGIGLGMFWGFTKYNFSLHIRTLPENISEQCASDGIIKGFFFALFMHIILFLIMSIWAFIKSPFVTIYRLVTRDFSFDMI